MKNLLLCTAIAGIVLCSCNNPRYINSPSAYNASFFRQQGDMKFSASASINPSTFNRDFTPDNDDVDNSVGFDGHAGFALSDHFLIELGGMYRTETDHFNDDDLSISSTATRIHYKRSLFHAGLGYYTPMGATGKNYFNLVVDGGLGKIRSTDDADPYSAVRHRNFSANLFKLSLNPAFNFFFNDDFRMSFAPRFALLRLDQINTNYTLNEEQILGYNTAQNGFMPIFEPSLHLQAGPRNANWLKFDFGFNFATNPLVSNNTDSGTPVVTESYDLYSRGFLLTFGLSFYPFEKR